MNMKVGGIIQYYAHKALGVLDEAWVVNQCEQMIWNILGLTKKNFVSSQLSHWKYMQKYGFLTDFQLKWVSVLCITVILVVLGFVWVV